jgi:hypothetical protein
VLNVTVTRLSQKWEAVGKFKMPEGAYLHDSTNKMQNYTGPFTMFSVITNIYNNKTKGPTLMEFFTTTG